MKPVYINTPSSCGQIHRPLVGDVVDSGIVLTYRLASLCSLTGRYDNPMNITNIIPPVRDYVSLIFFNPTASKIILIEENPGTSDWQNQRPLLYVNRKVKYGRRWKGPWYWILERQFCWGFWALTRVFWDSSFVWFWTLIFRFYKMIFMSRLEISFLFSASRRNCE